MVLQVVRFVEDQRRPRHTQEVLGVPSQDVVVDDDPFGGRRYRPRSFDDQDRGIRRDDGDLARPVSLDRSWTDNEAGSAWREVAQRDDRLSRLAEAHVVGEDGAPPAEQERDAFDLVREEPVGERDRAPEGRVGIAGQLEQLCERLGLRVERVGHGFGARTAQERQFVTVERKSLIRDCHCGATGYCDDIKRSISSSD